MKSLHLLKRILSQGCVYFTFSFIGLYLLGLTVDEGWIPTIRMTLCLLLFCLILAAANRFLFSTLFVFPLRLLIHFVTTALLFTVVFVFWGSAGGSGGMALTMMLLYTFSYIIVAALTAAYRYIVGERKRSQKPYSDVLGGDRDKTDSTTQFGEKK